MILFIGSLRNLSGKHFTDKALITADQLEAAWINSAQQWNQVNKAPERSAAIKPSSVPYYPSFCLAGSHSCLLEKAAEQISLLLCSSSHLPATGTRPARPNILKTKRDFLRVIKAHISSCQGCDGHLHLCEQNPLEADLLRAETSAGPQHHGLLCWARGICSQEAPHSAPTAPREKKLVYGVFHALAICFHYIFG